LYVLFRHVQSQAEGALKDLQKREGQVYCPNWTLKAPDTCPSPPFPDVDIAKHASPDVFKLHLASRMALTEQRLASQMEEEKQKQLKVELERLTSMDGMNVLIDASIVSCTGQPSLKICSAPETSRAAQTSHRRRSLAAEMPSL
jgi:hypothetical protein